MWVLTAPLKYAPPARTDSKIEAIGQLKNLLQQWRQAREDVSYIENRDNQQPPRVESQPKKSQVPQAPRVDPIVYPYPRVHNLPTPPPSDTISPIASRTRSKVHLANHFTPINTDSQTYPITFLNQWSNAIMDWETCKFFEYQHLMKNLHTRKYGAIHLAIISEDSHKAAARWKGQTHFSLSDLTTYLNSCVKTLLTHILCVKSKNTNKTSTEHESRSEAIISTTKEMLVLQPQIWRP